MLRLRLAAIFRWRNGIRSLEIHGKTGIGWEAGGSGDIGDGHGGTLAQQLAGILQAGIAHEVGYVTVGTALREGGTDALL